MTTPLAQVLTFPCGLVLSNRIVKTALSEGLGTDEFGVSDELVQLYEVWGQSGAGLLITGNVVVDRSIRESKHCVALDGVLKGARKRKFEDWARAGQRHGAKVLLQLTHPGRAVPKAFSERPVGPSALKQVDIKGDLGTSAPPRALTEDEINSIIARFAESARQAEAMGFDGVQIQAGHGHLIAQFLSKNFNRRQDKWGGTLKNRAHLILEIIRACRSAVKREFAIGVRLSCSDFEANGFSFDECLELVDHLGAEQLDFLDVSGGGLKYPIMLGEKGRVPLVDDGRLGEAELSGRMPFLDYAREVKARTHLPVLVSGGFRSSEAMEAVIEKGQADLVGLGRPFCHEPYLATQMLRAGSDLPFEPQIAGKHPLLSAGKQVFAIRRLLIRQQIDAYKRRMRRLGRLPE